MRRISSVLALVPMVLFLLAPIAMTGCSAHAGVHVDNPNHYANHFNNTDNHDQYAPHTGENYQLPAYQ